VVALLHTCGAGALWLEPHLQPECLEDLTRGSQDLHLTPVLVSHCGCCDKFPQLQSTQLHLSHFGGQQSKPSVSGSSRGGDRFLVETLSGELVSTV
jgi:hypothetical protein